MLKMINGLRYAEMLESGIKNVVKNKKALNDLNVFPVPDGDTGTNMTMTIMSAAKEVAAVSESGSMKEICKAISGGSDRYYRNGYRWNYCILLFNSVIKCSC